MDTGKIYHDSDGNECSIYQVVRREPDWAANRIHEGEKAIAKLAELEADRDCKNSQCADILETYRCMAISTGHLTEETRDRLQRISGFNNMVMSRSTGFFVKLHAYDGVEGIEEDYKLSPKNTAWKKIIDYAIANNFQLIEFDADAEEYPDFKVFVW